MSERLFTLLRRRMASGSVDPDQSVTVAELHRQLLPYHACRDELRFATKAEYDLEMLALLSDRTRIEVAEPALLEAVERESGQAEPGLGFLQRFAASEITVKEAPVEASPGPEEAAEEEVPQVPVEDGRLQGGYPPAPGAERKWARTGDTAHFAVFLSILDRSWRRGTRIPRGREAMQGAAQR